MAADKLINTVHDVVDKLWRDEVDFLQEFIRYESTLGNEAGIQQYIETFLKEEMNLKTDSILPDVNKLSRYENFGPVEWSYAGRPSIVGQWNAQGEKTGKSLILQGHIDVVSAEPHHLWDQSPYEPFIDGNRLYGRGALDMKAGVAAMIFAVKAIKHAGIKLGADLHIHSVIEEECTGNGALAILDHGYTADGALIPEPTNLMALSSQVGVIWLRVHVTGRGAHVERAQDAQNAINKACYLIDVLDKYRVYINDLEKHEDFAHHGHPLNVNVGTIKGGDWPSNVPYECTFEARIGLYPGTNPTAVQQEVKAWLLDAAAHDDWLKESPPEVTFYGFHAKGEKLDTSTELFQTLEKAHQATTNDTLKYAAFTGTTDVRAFAEFGIQATCYGPSGADMHGVNEYLNLDSLKTTTKTLAAFVLKWCGVQED